MRRTHIVRIKKTGRHCNVIPNVIVIAPGDKVRIINMTRDTVFGQILGTKTTFKLGPRQDKTVTVPGIRPGIYPVVVFCYESEIFCWTQLVKSSMPIIIVPKL